MAALFAFGAFLNPGHRGIFCSTVHLDEPQMNGVKLRHEDEPQMNSSVNGQCRLAPINRPFPVSRIFAVTPLKNLLPRCASILDNVKKTAQPLY
jgi:hypothetical protein